MEKKEYIQQSSKILEKILRLENDFDSLVRKYYLDAPKERGKKSTEFYKEMSGILDDCERSLFSMRDKLKKPDLIQGYNTK